MGRDAQRDSILILSTSHLVYQQFSLKISLTVLWFGFNCPLLLG
jgi:hypothetical protein